MTPDQPLLTFRDVVVTPYSNLLWVGPQRGVHIGGPHWPDFSEQRAARHQREGQPVDEEPAPNPARGRLAGRWAWAGPICAHFGHQIIEFSMRLMPTLTHDRDVRFLFAVPPSGRYGTIAATPPYFRAILDWFGITPARCHVTTTPLLVEELVVAPQAEQLGGPVPKAEHLDAMDRHTLEQLGTRERQGAVYVSRAGVATRFAGEDVLESALSASGVEVIRPETLPLRAQLRTYASAQLLIFAEGSAPYASALLGRSLGDVVVLNRRPGAHLGLASLRPRATSLRYCDVVREFLAGRNWRGERVKHAGLTVLDEDALLETFDALELPVRRHWDSARYAARCDQDVKAANG